MSFSDLLARWPSIVRLAEDVGRPYNTVAAWKRRDNIPVIYWPAVIASARRYKVKGVTYEVLLAASTRGSTTQSAAQGLQGSVVHGDASSMQNAKNHGPG